MKYLTLITLSFSAFANYIPKIMVGDCSQATVYTKASSCPGDCIKIPSPYFCQYHELVAETQMKEDVETCVDEADCEAKHAAKECSTEQATPIMNLDLMESYCTWTRPEQVMVNADKKSTYDTEKTAADAKTAALAQVRAARKAGESVIDEILYRNAQKDLTAEQRKTILTTYETIKSLLEVGNLAQAKAEVQAATPDGVLMTAADKTAIISKIDEYL